MNKKLKIDCRCILVKSGGLWLGLSIDFCLASQANTKEKAREKLSNQIDEYLYDAIVGEDRDHMEYFLNRRAPLRVRISYYLVKWLDFTRLSEAYTKTYTVNRHL